MFRNLIIIVAVFGLGWGASFAAGVAFGRRTAPQAPAAQTTIVQGGGAQLQTGANAPAGGQGQQGGQAGQAGQQGQGGPGGQGGQQRPGGAGQQGQGGPGGQGGAQPAAPAQPAPAQPAPGS